MKQIKILICAEGRHGKDTLCEILNEKYGLSFASSSYTAAEEFIFDKMKDSHGYKTVQECFDDRHTGDNRRIWYELISEFNKDDKARLAKIILSKNDIYCGLRSKEELDECIRQNLFDLTFWVDATKRLGHTEDKSSITITKEDCLYVLDNNSDLANLERQAEFVWDRIQYLESFWR